MKIDIHAIPYTGLGRIRFLGQAERGIARSGLNETARAAACQGVQDRPYTRAGRFGITSIGVKFVGERMHG